MRKNNYICDICGADITPMCRLIPNPQGYNVTSSHESIQQIVLKQIDVQSRNYILTNEQLSKSYDVCDACWDDVIKVLRNRKKGDINICQ